jgi:hypothetical protein
MMMLTVGVLKIDGVRMQATADSHADHLNVDITGSPAANHVQLNYREQSHSQKPRPHLQHCMATNQ